MGKRVVIDTNVLISALGWAGAPRKVLNKVFDGELNLYISEEILAKLMKVMNYPKFGFTEEQKIRFISLPLEVSTVIKPKEKLSVVKDNTSDNKFLECTKEAKANYIITGDEHLLKLKEYSGTLIQTPAEIADEQHPVYFDALPLLS